MHALEGRLREWRAAEIRVDDDAGRVQRAAQPGFASSVELLPQALCEVAGLGAGLDLLACARENDASGLDGERVVARAGELVDRGQVAELHWASAFSGSAGVSALRVP